MDDSNDGRLESDKQHEVQTLDVKRKDAVDDRVPSVDAAWALFDKYRRANVPIALADAKVMALHRGVSPYAQDKLDELGQGWRANFNAREMKGSINNRVDAAYDFHMDVDTRVRVTLRPEFQETQSPNPLLDYGQIIAEEYTYMLNFDWPDNYLFVDQTTRDRVKVGLGIGYWEDHIDWRPKWAAKLNFFMDPRKPPLPEHVPAFFVRGTISVQRLLEVISMEKASVASGWDVGAVKGALMAQFAPPSNGSSSSEPPNVRDPIVGGAAAFESWLGSRPAKDSITTELEELPVVRLWIRSAKSKKVSQYIMVDQNAAPACKMFTFLFRRIDQYETMDAALWLNPYNYAEGTLGSIDGLGHDLAPYCEISNRMLCTALDGGAMSSGLLLETVAGYDADTASVVRIGPTTVIPPGLKAVQSSFSPPFEKLLELRSVVRGVVSNNVGMTRMHPEMMEQAARGTRSRDEVALEKQREFRIETNSANFEYMTWTRLHAGMMRRAVIQWRKRMRDTFPGAKEAKAFVKRCLDRGVPAVIFEKFETAAVVEVNRTVGDGSPTSRTQIWGTMMEIRGDMDEAGRRHTQREFAASMLGYRNVDKVFPLRNRNQIPSNELSIAMLENNDFREGSYIRAGSDQIHVIHIEEHFRPLLEIAKAFNEQPGQADVETVLRYFSTALPHIEEHLQFLARDKTREPYVKSAAELLAEMVVFYRKVEKAAMAAMGQQQKLQLQRQQQMIQELESRMNSDAQVKIKKIELDAQLEALRQQALAETRQWAKEAQEQIKRETSEARAALEREMAERRMQLEEEMAQRKMQLEEARAGRG